MRYGILMTLLMWCSLSYPQLVLEHEKKIDIAEKYLSRDISFINSTDNTLLSGTLLEPKREYAKIVIIVPGSGKDTRHSHYQLAEKLLEENIAVFRFDDRGVGKSGGIFSNSVDILAFDIIAATQRIKQLFCDEKKEIGLLSHSLGGMASVIANQMYPKDNNPIEFLIQIASPVDSFAKATQYQIKTLPSYTIQDLTTDQTEKVFLALQKVVSDHSGLEITEIQQKGFDYLKALNIDPNQVNFWSYSHILLYQYKLKSYYKVLNIPTIYLIGKNDKIINANEETISLKKLENPKVTIHTFSGLDHYLTKGDIKNKDIYAIDKKATEAIVKWLHRI